MLTWAHLLTVQKKYVTKKDMYSSSTKYGKVAVSTTKYRKVAPNVAKCHKVKLCFADVNGKSMQNWYVVTLFEIVRHLEGGQGENCDHYMARYCHVLTFGFC